MMFLRYKQKKHTQTKIEITHKKIWDLEFMKAKLKGAREELRQEHDRYNEQIAGYNVRIEKLTERNQEGDQAEIKQCQDQLVRLNESLQQCLAQLTELDKQISGQGGVEDSITAHRSLLNLLVDYKKTL